MSWRRFPSFALVVLLLECGAPSARPSEPVDAATRRQRDSVVARMPVPGARAVDRALGTLEQTDRRNAILDSIGR